MALDPAVADQLTTMLITSAQRQQELNGLIDRNLTQSLGTINGNLLHQHGGPGDDSGTLAALQAAAGAPRQGTITPAA